MSESTEERYARANQRRERFFESLPQSLRDEEDAVPAVTRIANASTRSKLQKIYKLADAFMSYREPFTACKRGCADCCRMNISISSIEAARISAASGRPAKKLLQSKPHGVDKFAGDPCPFLGEENTCSIYSDRPLVCRNHASFDTDSVMCEPSVMNSAEMPMVNYDGLKEAMHVLTRSSPDAAFADIRDFFPKGLD
ncbi:YkgJ family cysteine cluster protein [Comamonas thiooxydans]|uniref:YkgJ family cysteine cluster protein n=1 Tax=Comamonas thiooxydans TaxID=363952 RepID=UPI0009C19088|nr:YkgJ family cysteine cluster protein [Comamonas thiooxydans]